MTAEVLKLLKETRTVLERGWTQEVYARDANGHVIYPENKDACQWCISGALRKASRFSDYDDAEKLPPGYPEAYRAILSACPDFDLVRYNDEEGRTQADVLDLMSRAISRVDNKTEASS